MTLFARTVVIAAMALVALGVLIGTSDTDAKAVDPAENQNMASV